MPLTGLLSRTWRASPAVGNQITWPKNRYKYERAQDLQNERIENGMFRCDRCDLLKPLPVNMQDGHKLCRRCLDPLSPLEAQTSMAAERAANAEAEMKMLEYPVTSCFANAPAITGVSPLTLNLTRGGSSGSIAITGVWLSASDTWAANSGDITVTPTVNSSVSVSLSISAAGGTPRADYSITFNGDVITPRNILKVR